MAEFGTLYGYKTGDRFVAAVATSDEDSLGDDTVVDLVLLGFANGQRKSVVVQTSLSDVKKNQAIAAADVDQAPVVFEDGVRF